MLIPTLDNRLAITFIQHHLYIIVFDPLDNVLYLIVYLVPM